MNRIFFVAGDASGDHHGARLVAALRARDPRIVCEGYGGVEMAAAGMDLQHDLAGEGIMGFTEVLRHLPRIRRLFHQAAARVRAVRPRAVVLIDYPGFNLRFARAAHEAGIPVIYYISPQVWAWKKGRLKTIAAYVDLMLVIFPFEQDFYREAGVDCQFVGHPLLDRIADYVPENRIEGDPVIGLLPGSRAQEIARLFPVMLETARGIHERHPGARFHVPCVNHARAEQAAALARGVPIPLDFHVGGMYDVLAAARFCLVASGTATLETALFGVPLAILYKVSPPSYWMARLLVDIAHIGIVNILAGRGLAPEFIQDRARPGTILPAALELIEDTPARRAMIAGLDEVRQGLGAGGASERAAEAILTRLEGSTG